MKLIFILNTLLHTKSYHHHHHHLRMSSTTKSSSSSLPASSSSLPASSSSLPASSSSSAAALLKVNDIEDILLNFDNKDYKSDYNFNDGEVTYFREELLKFYHAKRRLLPWRGDTVDGVVPPAPSAYGTWVSEIMLQQTRVETVIAYWHRWMEKFPTIQKLAEATQEDVNALWAGLGYYRRAKSLLECAQKVVHDYNGVLPQTAKALLNLPGIGEYTAGAISSIAYGQKEALVDGNVIRVLSRMRAIRYEKDSKDMSTTAWKLARQIVDDDHPGDFNQALMELGATVCKPTSPNCEQCPVRNICAGKHIESLVSNLSKGTLFNTESSKLSKAQVENLPNDVTYFPVKAIKAGPREVVLSVVVFQQSIENTMKYLFVKRPNEGLLANQWEFPNVIKWEEGKKSKKDEETKAEEVPIFTESELWEPIPDFLTDDLGIKWTDTIADDIKSYSVMTPISKLKTYDPIVHVFSHQRHTMHVSFYEVDVKTNSDIKSSNIKQLREMKWMTKDEIISAGVTTGCKKILETVTSSSKTAVTKKRKATKETVASGKKQSILNFVVKPTTAVDKKEETIIIEDSIMSVDDCILIEHCKS